MNRLIVCGGGHVGTEVALLGLRVGFEVLVVDDRLDYADPDRVPGATMVCAPFLRALADIGSRDTDYYVIMTHGHTADEECLAHVLNGKHAYVGMMGSARKVEAVSRHLLEQGYSQEQVDSVHMPIGLPIGGETPAEIAVSVAAQLIQVRSERGEDALAAPPDRSGVLCSVVSTDGSTPRTAGAWMLVAPDGSIQGTIGGGSLEADVIQQALKYWQSGETAPVCFEYELTEDADVDVGMICGGNAKIQLERTQASGSCPGSEVCGKEECPYAQE